MLFCWTMLLYPLLSSTIFPFLFFLHIGWYCGGGVFGPIRCRLLSNSLALPTSFINNNDYNIIFGANTGFIIVRLVYLNHPDVLEPDWSYMFYYGMYMISKIDSFLFIF